MTRCGQKHGTTLSSLLGNPSPQENKFLANDIAVASADGCSHQAPCCSIPSLTSRLVARATPPLTEARVGKSRSSVSLHPPNSPAQLSGPQQVFLALSVYTQAHPAMRPAWSYSHDKHPSGSSVLTQPSSEGFPGGLTNLNEAVAVPLIYTRTDSRLKMEAILKPTINRQSPSGG